MKNEQILQKTAQFVRQKMHDEGSHDWWHIQRVWLITKKISAGEENVDQLTVELGALLHDIADWKYTDGDLEVGPKVAREWLESLSVDDEVINVVEDIVRNTSYKGANVIVERKSIEAQIVSDADKVDALGAIGVARAFAYGGSKDRPLYVPDVKPTEHNTFEEYANDKSHTVNHFYEKLLLLADRMYTDTAKEIALERHKFMEEYLEQFYAEWSGER